MAKKKRKKLAKWKLNDGSQLSFFLENKEYLYNGAYGGARGAGTKSRLFDWFWAFRP